MHKLFNKEFKLQTADCTVFTEDNEHHIARFIDRFEGLQYEQSNPMLLQQPYTPCVWHHDIDYRIWSTFRRWAPKFCSTQSYE